MLLVVRGKDVGAGILFGLTIIKPQMVALLLPFVLALGGLQTSDAAGVEYAGNGDRCCLLVPRLIYPGWIPMNYLALLDFYEAGFPASPAAFLWAWLPGAGPWAMGVAAFILAGLLLILWWMALGKDERWFLWTAALTIVITNLVGLPTSISNHVLLIIPFALVFSVWTQRWPEKGQQLSLFMMGVILGTEWGLIWLRWGEI